MPGHSRYVDRLLDNLQANILKPHGRNHAWCLFLQFSENAARDIRNWVSTYLSSKITSESQQRANAKARKESQELDDRTVTCFFLAKGGCVKIALNEAQTPRDARFKIGMQHYNIRRDLRDPPVDQWEDNYQHQIDAMILIANNSSQKLSEESAEITSSIEGFGKILFVEKGKKLTFGDYTVKPFGFRDGISQPQLWYENGLLNFENCKKVVFVKEQESQYGSYLVFRKLEQDVISFNEKIIALANHLQIPRELVEAQVIGRFKDGTPLALFDTPGKVGSTASASERALVKMFDNYDPKPGTSADGRYIGDYRDDLHGNKCPFHAHIRKANPRLDREVNRAPYGTGKPISSRIVRRAIPYDEPGKGVGLLFMCYQKDIFNQFERIQRDWCNHQNFPESSVGIDPLIGHKDISDAEPKQQRWNKGWNSNTSPVAFKMEEVVSFKGGEYFYAPSIPFLQNLNTL